MVVIDDFEIFIVSTATGNRLQEYDNPEGDKTPNGNEVEKYIEAESNVEFGIAVVLKAGFNYHKADGVKVSTTIDGTYRERYYRKLRTNIKADCLVEEVRIERNDMIVERDGSWYRSRLSFGSVTVNESCHVDATTLGKQLNMLGSIKVAVQRVSSKFLDEPRSWNGEIKYGVDGLDKKLLVKNISHTFRPVGETKVCKTPVYRTAETPIKGKYGHASSVVFRYRSHLALQDLGCISTTPPPVPLSERAPAEMTDEEKASEIIRMRREILTQKEDIVTLSRANQELHGEIDEAKQIKERMNILQAALGGLNAVTTPTMTAPAIVTPTVRKPIIKRERMNYGGQDDTVASTGHAAKRSKPVYVELDD